MKICSTLLIIREMQIKIMMRYHLTTNSMAKIKNTHTKHKKTVSFGEDVEKRELSYTVGGNTNLCSHSGE